MYHSTSIKIKNELLGLTVVGKKREEGILSKGTIKVMGCTKKLEIEIQYSIFIANPMSI